MIAAIIQARTTSTRLPNKVFSDLSGKPLIWHVVKRLKGSSLIEKVILATSVNPADAALEAWATQEGVTCFRGSENDVLARFFHTAESFHARIVVRITADDPFKDPQVIDIVIRKLVDERLDFCYNNKPPSFPEGLDVEVFTKEALARAHAEAVNAFDREHVTQYLYRHPQLFKQQNVAYRENISSLRWTVDTPEDLEMAREVYRHLFKEGELFLLEDILNLFKVHPEIATMNARVERSAMYRQ